MSSVEAKPFVDENKGKTQTQQDLPPTTPLKHLIFKKMQHTPVEVR